MGKYSPDSSLAGIISYWVKNIVLAPSEKEPVHSYQVAMPFSRIESIWPAPQTCSNTPPPQCIAMLLFLVTHLLLI